LGDAAFVKDAASECGGTREPGTTMPTRLSGSAEEMVTFSVFAIGAANGAQCFHRFGERELFADHRIHESSARISPRASPRR